jgi:cytochrome c oxidase cbb3-type subunit 3
MTGIGLSAGNDCPAGADLRQSSARLLLVLSAGVLLTACGGGSDDAGPAPAELRAELRSLSDAHAGAGAATLRANGAALELGGRLFEAYCGACHGADGTGERGVPDLTRGSFDFGASADAIRTTIRDGRQSEMPGMGREYGEVELGQIVSYLGTFGSDEPLSDYDARGQEFYAEACAACHGDDGQGVPELGASNLADDYWQHGDSMMNKRLAVTRGVQSECPAHGSELTAAEIELLTAFTLQLAGR